MTRMNGATATGGPLGSTARSDLGVLGCQVGVLGAPGGLAGLDERLRSHFDPWRMRPERCLPADSLLPGTCPPTTRGVLRSGSGACRSRSQRGSLGRSEALGRDRH